ncbi:MAG: hypothetical protein Q9210_004550 [Variospora velana]
MPPMVRQERHEGEQPNMTKNGLEGKLSARAAQDNPLIIPSGNDFFDLSNIVSAGGTMTTLFTCAPKTASFCKRGTGSDTLERSEGMKILQSSSAGTEHRSRNQVLFAGVRAPRS